MTKKLLGLLALAACLASVPAHAALVFTIGTTGGSGNTWPEAEAPGLAIDDAAGTKYLNFGKTDTGYIFTPTSGSAVATGVRFTTANDAVERDPASYTLYGSNTVTASGVVGAVFNVDADFVLISTGGLSLPAGRNTDGGIVSFGNSTSYQTFLLLFPTVKDAGAANSMQINTARLQTSAGDLPNAGDLGGGQLSVIIPEPASLGFLALGLAGFFARRRRAEGARR